MDDSFYQRMKSCNILFELSPLYAESGWYIRLCNSHRILGPFERRVEAEHVADQHKSDADDNEQEVIYV